MRRTILFISLILIAISSEALEKNTKMGKPTMEELSMTDYAPEPDAKAVILYRSAKVFYTYTAKGFVLNTRHTIRIKVLKPEGADLADVGISYYSPESGTLRDIITEVKGAAYNLENGKMVVSKLSGDLKNRERVDKNHSIIKFSIPNVKEGTVFEYSYLHASDFFWNIDTWYAQQPVPVFYTEYEVETPEWFGFHSEQSGLKHLPWERTYGQFDIVRPGGIIYCTSNILKLHGDTLPSIKDDSHIWSISDYCTKVTNELSYIQLPGEYRKNFTQTWDDVLRQLMDDDDFGGRLQLSNPLKAEQDAAAAELQNKSVEEKTDFLRNLLMSRYKWNEKYSIYGLPSRRITTEESLNSATLNFILLSMLRDAGVTAYPVLLSRRSRGRIPYSYPSIQAMNATVLMVMTTDSTKFYTDAGSAQDGYPLMQLPANLMPDRALAVYAKESSEWVNLQELPSNTRIITTIRAEITNEGELRGHVANMRSGAEAAHFRMACKQQTDSADYSQRLATKHNCEIEGWTTTNLDGAEPQVVEEFDFSQQLTPSDTRIYFNPFLFCNYSSPFKEDKRVLPIEYGPSTQERMILTLRYPEGYEVEECPQSCNLKMPDGKIQMTLMAQNNPANRIVNINLTYKRTAMFYPADTYESLRSFWSQVEQIVGKMLVLKKTGE